MSSTINSHVLVLSSPLNLQLLDERRVDYDARFWTPQTFYVLYKSEQMRDAALAAAGVNKKTYLVGPVQAAALAGWNPWTAVSIKSASRG